MLGVSAQAVHNWHHAWNQGGSEALLGHGIACAQCALDENQRQDLRQPLRAGAKDYGFATVAPAVLSSAKSSVAHVARAPVVRS